MNDPSPHDNSFCPPGHHPLDQAFPSMEPAEWSLKKVAGKFLWPEEHYYTYLANMEDDPKRAQDEFQMLKESFVDVFRYIDRLEELIRAGYRPRQSPGYSTDEETPVIGYYWRPTKQQMRECAARSEVAPGMHPLDRECTDGRILDHYFTRLRALVRDCEAVTIRVDSTMQSNPTEKHLQGLLQIENALKIAREHIFRLEGLLRTGVDFYTTCPSGAR